MPVENPKRELLPDGWRANLHEHFRNNPEELEQFSASLQSVARGMQDWQSDLVDKFASVIETAQAGSARFVQASEKKATWLEFIDWQETKRRLDIIGDVLELFEASHDPGAKRLFEFLNDTSLKEVWEMMPFLKRPHKKRGRPPGRTEFYGDDLEQAVVNLTANVHDAGALKPRQIAAELARLRNRTGDKEVTSIMRHLNRLKPRH